MRPKPSADPSETYTPRQGSLHCLSVCSQLAPYVKYFFESGRWRCLSFPKAFSCRARHGSRETNARDETKVQDEKHLRWVMIFVFSWGRGAKHRIHRRSGFLYLVFSVPNVLFAKFNEKKSTSRLNLAEFWRKKNLLLFRLPSVPLRFLIDALREVLPLHMWLFFSSSSTSFSVLILFVCHKASSPSSSFVLDNTFLFLSGRSHPESCWQAASQHLIFCLPHLQLRRTYISIKNVYSMAGTSFIFHRHVHMEENWKGLNSRFVLRSCRNT